MSDKMQKKTSDTYFSYSFLKNNHMFVIKVVAKLANIDATGRNLRKIQSFLFFIKLVSWL